MKRYLMTAEVKLVGMLAQRKSKENELFSPYSFLALGGE